ncbi:MAG TPA: hypothetical protein VFC19_03305 [Candidatus Limnocylindrales bacterium]|nr:hypothetical protein [Candidatus Limnocylindrales bacterium]
MRTWIVAIIAAAGLFSILVSEGNAFTQRTDAGVFLQADEGSGNGPIGNGGFEWG